MTVPVALRGAWGARHRLTFQDRPCQPTEVRVTLHGPSCHLSLRVPRGERQGSILICSCHCCLPSAAHGPGWCWAHWVACPHLHSGEVDPDAGFSQCEVLWHGAYPSPLGLTSYCGHCLVSGLRGLRPAPHRCGEGALLPHSPGTPAHSRAHPRGGGGMGPDQWREERWTGASPHPR